MFKKRKAEISRRKQEIRRMLESGKDDAGNAIDIDALTAEVRALNDELAELERRESALGEIGDEPAPGAIDNPINDDNEQPEPAPEGRAVLATREYRSAFAKTFLRRALTPAEKRALDTALTTTATVYSAPTQNADGVNNGGLFIPTDINLALMQRIGLISPIFRDIAKTSVPGLLKFPYRKSISPAKNVTETGKSPELSIEWGELSLALSEVAATIAVSWRLKAMAVEEFFNFLLDELSEQIEDKGITEVIYGNGATGNQMKGITTDAIGYEYEGTALDGIGAGLAEFTDKRHKVGAKIYVAPNIIEEIAFTKNEIGDYIHDPINGIGINSVAGYKVEADPYLADGDFIIGNVGRYYRMNEIEALSLAIDTSGKNRRDDYTAWGLWGGALQPNTVVYGSKKTEG
jgi:HK97 family phage major capsid protein